MYQGKKSTKEKIRRRKTAYEKHGKTFQLPFSSGFRYVGSLSSAIQVPTTKMSHTPPNTSFAYRTKTASVTTVIFGVRELHQKNSFFGNTFANDR